MSDEGVQVGELKAVLASERIEREREFHDLSNEVARLRSRNHPWCSNVARDTAIRAAENAAASERPSLPDHRELPERVARLEEAVFTATAKCTSPVSKTGDVQSGLRTERVTLEIVHRSAFHAAEWAWVSMLELRRGESVRVVPSSEADAEVERLRGDVDFLKLGYRSPIQKAEDYAYVNRLLDERDSIKNERDAALARVAELERNGSASARETGQQVDAEPVAWMATKPGNEAGQRRVSAVHRMEPQQGAS